MEIEGEKTTRFRIFRSNLNNELLDLEFETSHPNEVKYFRHRIDYRYAYMVDGRRVDKAKFFELADGMSQCDNKGL